MTFIWAAFAAHDAIYLVVSRSLEYDPRFDIAREVTIQIKAIGVQKPACQAVLKSPINTHNWYKFNPNQVMLCVISSERLVEHWTNHSSIEVEITAVGMSKQLNWSNLNGVDSTLQKHVVPLLMNSDSDNFSNSTNMKPNRHKMITYHPSLIVGVTMIGPDVDATSIITWMQYHLNIGVPYFQLYYMVPISSLSVDHTSMLNEFYRVCGGCFSVMQWYSFYVPGRPSKQGEPPCSHLALINSVLHRLHLFKNRLNAIGKHQHVRLWLMQTDVDDFIVPLEPNGSLENYLAGLDGNIASVAYENSYFFLLPPSVAESGGDFRNYKHQTYLEEHRLKSNFTFRNMIDNVIIRESDFKVHIERPKLVHDVEHIVFGGAHRIDASQRGKKLLLRPDVNMYLHHIKTARGRNVSMIEQPVKTSLSELLHRSEFKLLV